MYPTRVFGTLKLVRRRSQNAPINDSSIYQVKHIPPNALNTSPPNAPRHPSGTGRPIFYWRVQRGLENRGRDATNLNAISLFDLACIAKELKCGANGNLRPVQNMTATDAHENIVACILLSWLA